jgi:hypothetical protein
MAKKITLHAAPGSRALREMLIFEQGGSVQSAIELLACIQFLIIGLSHLIQPRVWVAFFVALRDKGLTGVFVNGFLTLWFGSVIVVFHNVWTGLPIILTVIGWSQIIKAAVSFIAPRLAMRGLARVSIERAWEFQVAGVMLIGLSGVMAYLVALP